MKKELKISLLVLLVLALCMTVSAVPANAMVPPTTIYFDSLEEIKCYFDPGIGLMVDGKRKDVKDHISGTQAEEICTAMESLVFPYLEIDGKPAELGADWVPHRKTLDIIYVVDEIQYRFTYYFFSDYPGEEEEPTVRNVQAGPYHLDFKRKEHPNSEYWYLSGVREGAAYVSFWVRSDREDCLNYERFQFVHLSDFEDEKQEPEPEHDHWLLVAGAALVTAVTAGMIVLLIVRKKKARKNEPTSDE